MIGRKILFATLALAAFACTAAVVSADDKKEEKNQISSDLEHYFPIRSALAADKLDVTYFCPMHPKVTQDKPGKCPKCEMPFSTRTGIQDDAFSLATSKDKDVAKAGNELARAKDIDTARKAFGDLSKALIAEIDAATKNGEKFREVFIFECAMTKPFGKWVQESKEIGNPYQGSKMLTCGKLVDTKGDETCKDGCCDEKKEDTKKDDHHDSDHEHPDHKDPENHKAPEHHHE